MNMIPPSWATLTHEEVFTRLGDGIGLIENRKESFFESKVSARWFKNLFPEWAAFFITKSTSTTKLRIYCEIDTGETREVL